MAMYDRLDRNRTNPSGSEYARLGQFSNVDFQFEDSDDGRSSAQSFDSDRGIDSGRAQVKQSQPLPTGEDYRDFDPSLGFLFDAKTLPAKKKSDQVPIPHGHMQEGDYMYQMLPEGKPDPVLYQLPDRLAKAKIHDDDYQEPKPFGKDRSDSGCHVSPEPEEDPYSAPQDALSGATTASGSGKALRENNFDFSLRREILTSERMQRRPLPNKPPTALRRCQSEHPKRRNNVVDFNRSSSDESKPKMSNDMETFVVKKSHFPDNVMDEVADLPRSRGESPVEEKIDYEPYFHGRIGRDRADKLLMTANCEPGKFLIREKKVVTEFALSVRTTTGVQHHLIRRSRRANNQLGRHMLLNDIRLLECFNVKDVIEHLRSIQEIPKMPLLTTGLPTNV